MNISLITIQYGPTDLLERLLGSLSEHPDRHLLSEIIVVNNGDTLARSTRLELTSMIESVDIRVVDNDVESYAGGVNRGVREAHGDALLIANNDIEWPADESIEPLLEVIQAESVGIVGPQLMYPDQSWQRSFGKVPSLRSAVESVVFFDTLQRMYRSVQFERDWLERTDVGYIDGAFMLVRRDCFEEIGGFDEAFDFYGEDADFCVRAKKVGWNVVFEPSARIVHLRGTTSTQTDMAKYTRLLLDGMSQFVAKHGGALRASLFDFLLLLSLWERAKLYTILSKLFRSSGWSKRAREARARLRGVTGEEEQDW